MGTAYTPGLKVSSQTTIRRLRRLPLLGETLVTIGQTVAPQTIVARAALPGLMQSVKAAALLGIDSAALLAALRVKEGDSVAQGQLLAASSSFFGMFKSEAKSPVEGTVETISGLSGNIGIRRRPLPIELTAYLAGIIAEILPREGVIVEAEGALIQGIFGIGGERIGEIQIVSPSPESELTEEQILPAHAGQAIVGGSSITGGALRRAADIGVKGIIVGGIRDTDLIDYLGYDIGVAITGHEQIPLTLIITEGFGSIAMARRTYDLLASLNGLSASLSGATQIRAGVIRPEILVPRLIPDLLAEGQTTVHEEGLLAIGAAIRIIREPYFGLLATVSDLPPQLTTVESGASVRILNAKLPDGRTVAVPRANVELMEE